MNGAETLILWISWERLMPVIPWKQTKEDSDFSPLYENVINTEVTTGSATKESPGSVAWNVEK